MLIRHHTDAISLPLREKAVQNYAFLSELTSICPIFLRPAAPTPALRRARTELGKTKTELGKTKTELGETKTELGETKTELVRLRISGVRHRAQAGTCGRVFSEKTHVLR